MKDNFLFCQYDKKDPWARDFLTRYQLFLSEDDFPYVAVINPILRTIEKRVPKSQGLPKQETYYSLLLEFLESKGTPMKSLGIVDSPNANEFKNTKNNNNNNNNNNVNNNMNMNNNNFMETEDEELQRALAMSVTENKIKNNNNIVNKEDKIDNISDDNPEKKIKKKKEYRFSEPDMSASEKTRLQIMLPGGKRIKDEFPRNGQIKMLYAYLERNYDKDYSDLNKYVLQSRYPKLNLNVEHLEKTLKDTNLMNCALTLAQI